MQRITRRRMLKVTACAGAATWLAWPRGVLPVRRTRVLMGTTVHLTVAGGDRDAAAAAADATLERMAELEALLSRYRPGSEVARLNREGSVAHPSAALLEVLRLAQRVHALGEGAFDLTIQPALDLFLEGAVPSARAVEAALSLVGQEALHVGDDAVRLGRRGMAITLDGIGKGYVVDEGVAVLRARGFPNVLVEAGGDLVASGRREPAARWRIGIRRPRPGPALLLRIDAEDVAVATSGDYFQAFTPDLSQHHILDPRTGFSAPELASATVIAPTAALADGLATMAMVLGSRRTLAVLEGLPGSEACLVTKGSEVIRSSGFVPA